MKAIDKGPVNPDARGDQRLYELDPPLSDYDGESYQYVVVSAADLNMSGLGRLSHDFGIETYIFPADEHGDVISWSELPGSVKGTLDHNEVLRDLGYEVVQP